MKAPRPLPLRRDLVRPDGWRPPRLQPGAGFSNLTFGGVVAVLAAALKMEVQTLGGRELGLPGLPAQQVSEKGAGLQVRTPPFCLVVGKAPTSPLLFSRGQKQREGLGVCTFEGIVRWSLEIFARSHPRLLRAETGLEWGSEAGVPRRVSGRTCLLPAPLFPRFGHSSFCKCRNARKMSSRIFEKPTRVQ